MSLKRNELVIGPVRLAYMAVVNPRPSYEDDDEKEYSLTALIPKKPTEKCAAPDAILSEFKEKVEEIANAARLAKGWKNPLRDGDEVSPNTGEPKHPGYWYIKTKCKFPPALVDGKGRLMERTEPFGWVSGDWGKVKIALFAYDRAGNRGVSCGLRAVQFLYHDEPFGGDAAAGFEAVEDADPPRDEPVAVHEDFLPDEDEEQEEEEDPFKDDAIVESSWFDKFPDDVVQKIKAYCAKKGLDLDEAAQECANAIGIDSDDVDALKLAFSAWCKR